MTIRSYNPRNHRDFTFPKQAITFGSLRIHKVKRLTFSYFGLFIVIDISISPYCSIIPER